ncbi:MAG: hypothetical protein LBV67_06280 [Streptococcaceae bacterium]|nr:hypothetical protein [Streptococcaceae bacterium]
MGNEWVNDTRLTTRELGILYKLNALKLNDLKKFSFGSHDFLIEYLGESKYIVNKAMINLAKHGYIENIFKPTILGGQPVFYKRVLHEQPFMTQDNKLELEREVM